MKSITFYLFSELSSKILPFLTILIISRIIDPVAFGELTLYFIVYEFLIIFIGNNISATTRIDYFSLNKIDYIQSKKKHIYGSFVVAFLLVIFGKIINVVYPINYFYFILLIMSSLFRAISLFVLADLQCREKSYLYAKLNLVYIISLNVAFVYLIYIGMSISSWYYSLLLGALLQMIFALHVLKKEYANLLKSNYKFDFIYIFNEYKKGLIFIPQAVGFWIKLGIDRLLLSVFASAYILGQYMFGYQLLFPIIILSAAINLYMTPLINKNIIAKNFEFILKRLNVFFVFIMFFFIIALIVSKYFILNFYFDKYYNAIKYLVPLGLSMFFQSSMLIFINVFYYIKKKSFVSYFIFSTSIVNFVIGYLAMKTCGVTGLLYTNVIINLSLFMFIFIKLKLTLKKISSFES